VSFILAVKLALFAGILFLLLKVIFR